jgi:CHASE2 domain-containing sensor protein
LEEVNNLHDTFKKVMAKKGPELKRKRIPTGDFDEFLEKIEESQYNLNGDALLARSVEEAGNVVLPMYFHPGKEIGNNLDPLPAYFEREKLTLPASRLSDSIPAGVAAIVPIADIGKAALALGHSNLTRDVDGTIRRMAPVFRYGQAYYPSFGLQIAREFWKLQRDALVVANDRFVLQKAAIPTDETASVFIEFAGPAGTFKKYSAIDVLTGAVPEKAFEKKIVLIGVTAPGAGGDSDFEDYQP